MWISNSDNCLDVGIDECLCALYLMKCSCSRSTYPDSPLPLCSAMIQTRSGLWLLQAAAGAGRCNGGGCGQRGSQLLGGSAFCMDGSGEGGRQAGRPIFCVDSGSLRGDIHCGGCATAHSLRYGKHWQAHRTGGPEKGKTRSGDEGAFGGEQASCNTGTVAAPAATGYHNELVGQLDVHTGARSWRMRPV